MNKHSIFKGVGVLITLSLISFLLLQLGALQGLLNVLELFSQTIWWKIIGAALFLGAVSFPIINLFEFQSVVEEPASSKTEIPVFVVRRAIK